MFHGDRMRVIVTGGAGFVGSNLTRALVAQGHDVVVVDNLAATWSLRLLEDVADRIDFVHGDIRVPEDLERVGAGPFDRVYHLAASFANELSMEYPAIDMRSNIEGTLNVLALARRTGCGLFVYAGSSSSYGDVPVPFEEDGPTRPYTPYAISKQVGETYVRFSGLRYAIFRLFNVYGPGDPPGRYRNAVPNMMRALGAAARADPHLRPRGDAGLHLRRRRGEGAAGGGPRAPGSSSTSAPAGRRRSSISPVRSCGCSIFPRAGCSLEEARTWDRVVRRCASVTRLQSLFGWVPSTPLADGLHQAAQWMRSVGYVGRVGVNLPERILFVGAHCDDIELIAGGLLARACFGGHRVGVLVFSDHRGIISDAAAARARNEFRENMEWLSRESGTEVRDHSGPMLPACRGAFQSERGALYAAMEALRADYDMVVTHVPDRHQSGPSPGGGGGGSGLQGARHR